MGQEVSLSNACVEPSTTILRPAPQGDLLLAPGARWVCPPGGAWQDLRERHAVRRLLLKLIDHQREAPGHGLSLPALREAGWPGERMLPDAASNRIYVAMTQLRKLGFKPWLKRSEEGYFLDPALTIDHLVDEPVVDAAVTVRRRAGA
jgi:hypothetical protein